MASNRMYLRCKACSAEIKIGVYNQPGPWDSATEGLSAWLEVHSLTGDHDGQDADSSQLDAFAGEWYELAYE